MDINLFPKQYEAFNTLATEVLYGGAAGGGKSYLMRIASILWCYEIPNLQVYLFRRTFPDLKANHLEGPAGLPALLAEFIDNKVVKYNKSDSEFEFWNGAKIHLCHCQYPDDVLKYQGAEIHVLMIDELTHWTEDMYRFLRNRVRMAGVIVPEKYQGRFPRIMCGTNPGGIGHAWVKRTFVTAAPEMEIHRTAPEEGKMLRQYIPAVLEDNPALTEEDPMYEHRLTGLGSPELVKAMRYGIWDINAGAALETLCKTKNKLRAFTPPDHWTKIMTIDWGTAKPFSVGWYCVADDDLILKPKGDWGEKFVPKGALIRFDEYYGWNGKEDEGCRLESSEVARKIVEIEEEMGLRIDYRVGDSAMWAQHDGPSVQERMFEASKGKIALVKSRKDRMQNYQEVRARIKGEVVDIVNGVEIWAPMLYATENCTHFWRTLPDLQIDEKRPELGPDSSLEDHVYDEVAYTCASRPYITTSQQRRKVEYSRARKNALGKKSKSRYAT